MKMMNKLSISSILKLLKQKKKDVKIGIEK